jgi:hypothetical protein
MNAGHTPNHSIHHFDLGDSGNATPTQKPLKTESPSLVVGLQAPEVDDEGRFDGAFDGDDGDFELRGPLALVNDGPRDDLFLQILDDKLKNIPQSSLSDPSVNGEGVNDLARSLSHNSSGTGIDGSVSSIQDEDDSPEPPIDEMPRLRVKASTNFGKPFGTL